MVPELTRACGCVWVSSMFRGSGGQLGGALLAVFRRLLNPLQVGDLADGGPRPTLQRFASCPRLRILCCGGDGTVAWVMSAVDELHMACSPAVAILPLGTGNDFARVMQWGGGAGGSVSLAMARRWLRAVADSHVSMMDRWMVAIHPMPATDAAPPSSGKKPRDTNASAGGGSGAGAGTGAGAGAGGSGVRRRRCGRRRGGGGRTSTPRLPPGIPPERKVMNIYMGIGVGAQVALQVCMCTVVYVYGCVCVFVCVYCGWCALTYFFGVCVQFHKLRKSYVVVARANHITRPVLTLPRLVPCFQLPAPVLLPLGEQGVVLASWRRGDPPQFVCGDVEGLHTGV